jgi:hypothetical protein
LSNILVLKVTEEHHEMGGGGNDVLHHDDEDDDHLLHRVGETDQSPQSESPNTGQGEEEEGMD